MIHAIDSTPGSVMSTTTELVVLVHDVAHLSYEERLKRLELTRLDDNR